MRECSEFDRQVIVIIGHVVKADQIGNAGRGNGCLETVRLGDQPVGQLATIAGSFDS